MLNKKITKSCYQSNPFPYFCIHNALDTNLAVEARKEILNLSDQEWDRYQNPFENKWTLRNKFNLPPHVTQIFNNLTSQDFIDHLSKIVGIPLENDSTRNWWGIHKYDHGDFLDVHVDAGLHPTTGLKKQFTIGLYLSQNWSEINGGHLELWEGSSSHLNDAKLYQVQKRILPEFNTLIGFECNDFSWHGNPEPVKCLQGEKRIFLTLSYVSKNYQDLNKRVKAFFVKRPHEPDDPEKDKLRLLRSDPIKYREIYNLEK